MWVIEEARTLADEWLVFTPKPLQDAPVSRRKAQGSGPSKASPRRGWLDVSVVSSRRLHGRARRTHGIDYLLRGIRNTHGFRL